MILASDGMKLSKESASIFAKGDNTLLNPSRKEGKSSYRSRLERRKRERWGGDLPVTRDRS